MFKRVSFISDNRLVFFSLIVIFFLGLFLRLYRLDDFMIWQDSARDFMVAERILKTNLDEGLLIAPLAAGSSGYLANTPTYYYFIAWLTYLFPHPLAVTLVVTIIGSFSILFNYLSAKKMSGEMVGLLAAAFTSFSFVLISQSNSIGQPSILPAFISLFFLSLILAYQKKSFFWSLLAILIFWWFFHIHYSILIIIPSLFFAFLKIGTRIGETKFGKQKIVYLATTFVALGFSWYALSNNNSRFDLLSFFYSEIVKSGTKLSFNNFLISIIEPFDKFIKLFISRANILTTLIIVFLSQKLLIAGINRKKKELLDFFPEVQLGLIFLSISLFTFFSKEVSSFYFIFFMTLFPLLLAKMVEEIWRWKKFVGFSAFLLIFVVINFGNQRLFKSEIGLYERSEIVSDVILKDMKSRKVQHLNKVFVSSKNKNIEPYGWFSPKYWYFLEKKTNQKVVTLTKRFNNLSWSTNSPEYIYLICEDFDFFSEQKVIDECITPYQRRFSSILEKKYEVILVEELNEKIYVFSTIKGEALDFLTPLLMY